MALGNEIIVMISANAKKLQAGLAQASSGLRAFATRTGNFIKNNKLLITGALVGIGAGIAKTIKAYGEQEKAVVTLTQALKNQGVTSQAAIRDQIEFASAMQRVTTFGDEEVIGLQALLAQYGATGEELKNATKLTLDLAAAKGIDLRAAADLVGKAFVGETGTLSRYGIIIDKNIPRTEKFAAVTEQMQKMFGGQAEAQRKTTLGQIKAFGNAFGDLQETIGSFMAGEGTSLIMWLTKLVENMDDSLKSLKTFALSLENFGGLIRIYILDQIRSVALMVGNLLTMIPEFASQLDQFTGQNLEGLRQGILRIVRATNEEIAAINESARAAKEAADKKIGATDGANADIKGSAEEVYVHDIDLVNRRIQAAILENQEKARLAFENELAQKLSITNWTNTAFELTNMVIDQFATGVADMIMEGKRFSEVMKELWQDLARAIIAEIMKMIAKWLVFMALTGGKGAFGKFIGFQHGGIIGEPSIIRGLRTGREVLAGEAGPEAVVPIGGAGLRATAPGVAPALAAAAGGGGGEIHLTININGQFLEGSPAKWSELFRSKIMPEIRRYTMTNPTSQFIRRRGAA